MPPRVWARAAGYAVLTALVLAIPTRIVANSFFTRMTPVRTMDYVFLVASSCLIGLILALRGIQQGEGVKVAAGGAGTFLAVGCPVCNKVVVALLGTSGALGIFAPLQPVLGLASVILLAVALRHRLAAWQATSCELQTTPAAP